MRSRLPLLLTACFALPTFALGDTLQRSGPAEDCLDLVILGDGYRSTDRADFESDARRLWDQLRTTEPFTRYAGLMNVHTGFRASSIRGPGENNAYGTHFVTLFGTRLRATRMTLLLADAVRAGGEADAVIVLVNTNRRGGTAIGSVCFASSSAPRVGIHELGHVIGRLGDEYSSFSGTPSLTREQLARIYPNLTTASTRAQLPWKDWVAASTPVPGSFFTSGVSAFQGGGAYSSGLYRPRRACRMRTDGPGFCEVCRQHLVMALHEGSRPLQLVFSGSGSARRARLVSPLPNGVWRSRWSGVQAQGLEANVPAGLDAFVDVEDATPWVLGEHRRSLRYRFDLRTGAGALVPGGSGRPARVVGVSTRLRVRARPTTASTILGHLQPGAAVRVLGPAESGFFPIEFDGGTGYVGQNFIRLESPTAGLSSVVGRWAR